MSIFRRNVDPYIEVENDSLCVLPNRAALYNELVKAIYNAQCFESSVALLMVELRGFANFCNGWDVLTADAFLQKAFHDIKSGVHNIDFLGRFSIDKLGILQAQPFDLKEVMSVIERVIRIVAQPVDNGSGFVMPIVNVGACMSGSRQLSPSVISQIMMTKAITALYVAKNKGDYEYQIASVLHDDEADDEMVIPEYSTGIKFLNS